MAFGSSKEKVPSINLVASANKPESPNPRSVLSTDLVVVGDVTSKGEIEINGTVEGAIDCHTLTIGGDAKIQGIIVADKLEVRGDFDGLVRAETISIFKTAQVTGEVVHHSLSIEPGASVDTRMHRLDGESVRTSDIAQLPSARSDRARIGEE